MKQGWDIKTVGVICDIKTGRLDANAASENGAYPFFTCSQAPLRIDNYAYDCECVLVAGNGELNAKYYNGKFNAYQRTYIITTKSEYKNISVKYLYKFFSKYIEQLRQLSIGGVIKYIKLGNLTDATLPIPPREEQERIVEELDCLSGVIEKKREQLRELDALAQSIFYQMFGDPSQCEYKVRRLADLSNAKLSYGSGASAIEYDGETRYVRITDIKEDGELNEDKASPSVIDDKYLLNEGDILFARSGATVGKTYHYKEKDGRAIYAGYLIRFIPNTQLVLPSYIFQYTKTAYYRAFIQSSAQAVAQPNINAQQYGSLLVPVPPLTLQQEFADKIEAIEKQKELIKKSISEVEDLFNSRMSYYFN